MFKSKNKISPFSKRIACLLCISTLLVFTSGCTANNQSLSENKNVETETYYEIPDYSQYITLGEYKGLKYTIPEDSKYDEQDIITAENEEEKTIFSDAISMNKIMDKTVSENDTVNVTYHGTINGTGFLGSDSGEDGEYITVGLNEYGEEFEQKLIGMKPGETKKTTLKLYDGRIADYEITLNYIYEYNIPEITDELVKEYTDYETYYEYHTALDESIRSEFAYYQRYAILNILMDQIIENSTFTGYPEDELASMNNDADTGMQDHIAETGLTEDEFYDQYIHTDKESYKKQINDTNLYLLKVKMIIFEIAKKENIKITESDLENEMQYEQKAHSYHNDNAETLSKDIVAYNMITHEIEDILLENATEITE